MKKSKEKYILRINNEGIEVTKTIYEEYYRLMNREIYLINRDKKQGLLYYDAWDTEQSSGCYDLVMDLRFNTEEKAIKEMEQRRLWNIVSNIQDKYKVCYYTALGFSDREIAEVYGVSHNTIHKQKKRIFEKIKRNLENF